MPDKNVLSACLHQMSRKGFVLSGQHRSLVAKAIESGLDNCCALASIVSSVLAAVACIEIAKTPKILKNFTFAVFLQQRGKHPAALRM